MTPSKGQIADRLRHLQLLESRSRCPSAEESGKKRFDFVKALYEEAKEIAVSDSDKRIVQGLRFSAARILAVDPDGFITYKELKRRTDEIIEEYLE